MPIQIIDNFDLTSAKPIDNRIVVGTSSFYVNRDLISHKYPGLRIWDLNDSIPYVWTGATWSNENSSGAVTSQNGTASYISKFVGLGSTIANSVMFESTNKIGINTLSPSETLEVNGNVRATLFKGSAWLSGAGLSNINLGTNGSNLFAGSTIGLGNIQNGSSGQILVAGVSSPAWTTPSTMTIGNATNTNITNDSSTNTQLRYITFVDGTSGNRAHTVSSGRLQFNPLRGQLLLYASSTAANPAISFISDDNTGIYRTSAGYIGFSTGGLDRFIIADAFVTSTLPINLPNNTAASPSLRFSDPTTGFYRPNLNHIGMAINGVKRFIARTGLSSDFEFYSPNGLALASLIVDNTVGFYFSLNSSEKFRVNSNGVYISSQMDVLSSNYDAVSLSFSGGSPFAITPVLSTVATTYFWFGGAYWYLYLEVESAPGSGVYNSTHRARNASDDSSPNNYGAVLVPAGCRVKIFIPATGGATGYYRKFGHG